MPLQVEHAMHDSATAMLPIQLHVSEWLQRVSGGAREDATQQQQGKEHRVHGLSSQF